MWGDTVSVMFVRRRRFVPFIVFFVIILILFTTAFGFIKVHPLVVSVAKSHLNYIGNKVVNSSIEKHFKDVNYSDIVSIVFNANNEISAVSVDFAKLNTLKSQIMLEIANDLDAVSETEISIPLGNFFNNEFLMGIGPDIPFKLVPYGTVNVNFRDQFTGMGINQTVHEIYLDVNTEVGAIMPGMKTSSKITTSMMVAHTVIVGNVPQNYTGVNEIQGQMEDYILDVIP